MSITPKNWETFQHYKDRSPPWIKLHRGLLDNVDYYRLSPEAAKALPLIWIIASERDGIIPAGAELAFRLRLDDDLANDILEELLGSGFLVEKEAKPAEQGATPAQRAAKANGFGSRHISDAVKRIVWERDGGQCCQCNSTKNIEYDHKHPVSKGGNSDADNIQLLCRPCNRSKRTKLATQPLSRRSLEVEVEVEKETETQVYPEANASGAEAPPDPAIPEREYFLRGREVLGNKSGALIANLLKAKGKNVALARAALEQASQKQNPTEFIAAICRGPPGKPLTQFQRDQHETKEILNELGHFARGGSGGSAQNLELLPDHSGERSKAIRGGSGETVIDVPRAGYRASG